MRCAGCGTEIAEWSSYLLRIELYAGPEAPPLDEKDFERDRGVEMETLLDRLRAMSQEEIEAEESRVYERRVFRLCAACRERWHQALCGRWLDA